MAALTPETFLAVTEMIASQLRIKKDDRWTPHICRLKFHSFTSEFPEINETQFMWAAEQWIQWLKPEAFARYPTWKELMSPLYRSENGMANRTWGFRQDLPRFCQPSPEQLQLLPAAPRSLSQVPDPQNQQAYAVFESPHQQAIAPSRHDPVGLTPDKWQDYLTFIQQEEGNAADQAARTAGNP